MLDVEEDRRQGFLSRLTVECSTCDNGEVLHTSTSVSHKGEHISTLIDDLCSALLKRVAATEDWLHCVAL